MDNLVQREHPKIRMTGTFTVIIVADSMEAIAPTANKLWAMFCMHRRLVQPVFRCLVYSGNDIMSEPGTAGEAYSAPYRPLSWI